ncbi:lytic transglycosylase domain-containing protein [Alcaligenes nematophilus]|jgi:soluble lytic murein transglycosylase-like protein|uniref:Lytic transglycosylase domain-containing protein n=1 Tax=Alcaligenes nematophilus TaxID=2994643 RepID=A0ABU3MNG7_9BURK|nr:MULTISPECIES: lytic transglycosylase domain-containing protein [Alcaligenes]MDT8465351.1 lytic transglycosylase domain-containing protein [Alcaligenes nematophilus]MDT8467757.1 lytic transglycosylase domain-containing protein [Alcaligenes nematophilus]MDT8503102.1 lytic transglycosylase domain-containing protein [Alcaligenes nematophilus]MDT8526939.1 lytic transglycosylase domain-containing protein [Alcaligenes nematophilus]ULH07561.1 lytic transglycosylase domain-containing protein [Alcali
MGFQDMDYVLSRSARTLTYRIGEFVHVCAMYLGIAVLVTIAACVVVPSMRAQFNQLYTGLVQTLRPEAVKYDAYSQAVWPADKIQSNLSEEGEDLSQTEQQQAVSTYQGFMKNLRASVTGQPIAGVTAAQQQALRSYLARKYKIAYSVAGALIHTAFIVGKEKNLDPQLILAVIAIESRYNPYAESHVGAQGLMQVMTKVHKEKFDIYMEGTLAVLSPEANIRVGAQILSDCIRRRGSIEGGLACYVGATGPSDGGYGAKVLAERRRIALASGIPIRAR